MTRCHAQGGSCINAGACNAEDRCIAAPLEQIPEHFWLMEHEWDALGIGTAFKTEKEARDEARCWGGAKVFGPFVHEENVPATLRTRLSRLADKIIEDEITDRQLRDAVISLAVSLERPSKKKSRNGKAPRAKKKSWPPKNRSARSTTQAARRPKSKPQKRASPSSKRNSSR